MTDDLRSLLGDDVPEAEVDRLRYVDAALRALGPPPEVPPTLTAAVLAASKRSRRPRARLAAAVAAAAALVGAAFGIGIWVGGGTEGPPLADRVTLQATPVAPPDARMVIDVLPVDDAGNWAMAGDVTGLPALPQDGYYEVWMTKSGELAASCGRFVVDESGRAQDVWLNAPYDFERYDRWVVVAVLPGEAPSPWLLDGPVGEPA